MLLLVPILIVGAVWSTVVLWVAVVGLALQLVGFVVLLRQIRNERQHPA